MIDKVGQGHLYLREENLNNNNSIFNNETNDTRNERTNYTNETENEKRTNDKLHVRIVIVIA
jgi:hypothetical protein